MISPYQKVLLPPVKHIRRAIRRYKQPVNAPHHISSNHIDMIILFEYQVTADGEDFLIYGGLID